MVKAAVIEGGKVINVVVVPGTEFAESKGWVCVGEQAVSPGDEYDSETGTFIREIPVPVDIVPERITTLQAELQLIEDGLLQPVNNTIEALPEPERLKASAKWHKSRYIYRADSLVEQLLVVGLGRTEEQVDQMFISAAAID